MTANATLLKLLDLVQAELPSIARQVVESTGQALKADARHFGLLEPWARRRGRFAMEFETEIRPQLARLRLGQAPQRSASVGLDSLSLVDEHQALRDVGIAHVVELVTEASRTELFQLSNFFNALQGHAIPGRDSNALRPALFGRALANALVGADLQAEAHYALVRVAAPGLAEALAPLYQRMAAVLRDDRLTPLVSTRQGQERPRRRDARDSQNGQLADWHARELVQSTPGALPSAVPAQGLLERLYERMLADPALIAPVKAQLARLQVAVARLSRDDPSLLVSADHPTWRLINAVAAYAGGFQNPRDARLEAFLRFLEEQTQALVEAPHPSSEQFAYLLRLVDAFIARQARERSQPSDAELAALQREDQRAPWLKLVREQLAAQIGDAPLEASARRFLLGPWAELIVQAMVHDGQASTAAQGVTQLVDELLDSLRPRRERAEREQLRLQLPELVRRIEQAMAAVSLSEAKGKSLLLELMQMHSRVLSGQVKAESGPRRAAAEEQPDELTLSRFVEERDSAYASVWAHAQVDRSALPTQPLPLQEAQPSQLNEAHIWLDQLPIGGWLHLFVDGGWDTAQLVWIGSDHRLFLFISQDGERRYTLTLGALVQLYLNGLVMYLEQENLVERAVATLMQDLDR